MSKNLQVSYVNFDISIRRFSDPIHTIESTKNEQFQVFFIDN